jgi:TrpR family transcriptional regulator, trp operon repressor
MKKINEIASVLAATKDKKVIEKFLLSLLTRSEVEEISSRWELVKLLNSGLSQRKIASKLGLSLCKITRGSRELKKKSSAFKHMINVFTKNSNNH